jgi:hypothetical protein
VFLCSGTSYESQVAFEKKRDLLVAQQKIAENELQEQIERAQQHQREKDVERRKRRELDRKLIETIPLINEANAIADELSKPTVFAIKLVGVFFFLSTFQLSMQLFHLFPA